MDNLESACWNNLLPPVESWLRTVISCPARRGVRSTCEPTGSLVQRRSLKRENGRTSVADKSPEREWLASRDPWFRPVNLIEGPEGIIYVVDMYRAVIYIPKGSEGVEETTRRTIRRSTGPDLLCGKGRCESIERDNATIAMFQR